MTDDDKKTSEGRPRKKPGPQKLFYKGRPVSLEELADMAHVSKSTMSRRINKMNLTPEQAVAKKYAVSERKKKGQIIIEYKGVTDTLSNWAKRVGLRLETLYERLYSEPTWTYAEALGGAPRRRPNSPLMTPNTPKGPVTKSRKEWSQELGISLQTIAKRVSRGWNDSQALGFAPPPISFVKTNRYARTEKEKEERRLRYAAKKEGLPVPRKPAQTREQRNEARRRRYAEKRKQQQTEDDT